MILLQAVANMRNVAASTSLAGMGFLQVCKHTQCY